MALARTSSTSRRVSSSPSPSDFSFCRCEARALRADGDVGETLGDRLQHFVAAEAHRLCVRIGPVAERRPGHVLDPFYWPGVNAPDVANKDFLRRRIGPGRERTSAVGGPPPRIESR